MSRRVVLDASATFAALVFLGCGGGGGDDGGVTTPPPPAAVASVSVTLLVSTVNVGQTSTATAVVRDAQNNVLNRTVTWSSSNTNVATVSGTGTVTGVSPGTASITAGAESKTGSAQITVAALPSPPQISTLTFTQNGQAANLTQVAGKLTLNFGVDAPAGYSGTVIVKLDTVEVYRQPISAPYFVSSAEGNVALPVTVPQQVEIETTLTTLNVTTDQIREIPAFRNGSHVGLLQIVPATPGGPTVQQQFNVTTNNPIHAHGYWSFNGTTAIGADSKTYTGGDGVGSVVFAVYGTEVITGYELTLTDFASQYRNPAGGSLNVYQKITRTDLKNFTIPALPVESPNLTYILSSVTVDGVNVKPQTVYIGNAQYTTDLTGSGFANTQQQAQGLTSPAGLNFQLVVQPSVDLLNGTLHGRLTLEPFNLDNLGPRQISLQNEPVLSFLNRMTTVGGAALWPGGGFGANNNQLASRYDFADGFRSDRLTDATGIDIAKTEFYASPISDQANLFKSQYKIGTTFSLGESNGSRLYTAGARAFDKRGNYSDWTIRTSTANAWNVQGQLSLGSSIGLDVGAFGFTQTRASLNVTAMPSVSVWNQSLVDAALCWVWLVTNSVVGVPNGFLSIKGFFNGLAVLGASAAFNQYQIINSVGGVSGGSATFFLAPVLAQMFANAGALSNQGLYEFDFKAADNAGRYIGDNLYPRIWKFLLDYAAPQNAQVSVGGNVTPGTTSTFTVSGTDNYGLSKGLFGYRFNFPSALFTGGQAYVPSEDVAVQGTFDGTTTKSLSGVSISGIPPVNLFFYDPVSGNVDTANPYRSNGAMVQWRDFAWNLSPVAFTNYNNSAPIPTLTNVSSVKSSVSTMNWNIQSTVNLNFNYFDDRATGDPQVSKVQWFAIPSAGGGVVYPLGKTTTYTSAVEGTGRRITYDLPLNLRGYCGQSGPAQVFPVGWNAEAKYILKAGSFFGVNIATPVRYSNDCNSPPPPP